DDECICCRVKRIFHKGSKASFNNQEFEIEFNNKVDKKSIISITQEKNRLLFKKSNRYYWRPEFKFDRTKFILTDCENFDGMEADIIVYPAIVEKLHAKNSKEIEIINHKQKYKELFESDTTKNKEVNMDIEENWNPQIESSTSHIQVQEEESSKEDLSDNNSDDSDYIRKKKKGKTVVDSVTKNLIAEKESIDFEQARIQSNYIELNNKSQDPEEFLSESELYESDIILDISEDMPKNTKKCKQIDENIHQNFEQKNKDNPEFKRLKRLFK
ncbi:21311_t:CDS:1, partial [Dentiscutata erythropus]